MPNARQVQTGSTVDEIDLLIPDLWEIIKRKDCVAWVGSGLSIVADYPDWGATVARLCTACRVAPPADDHRAELLLEKAEECKNADGRAYQQTLAELFGRRTVQTRHAYNLIMTLPFKAYITTNFDPLLAAAGMTHGHTKLYTYPSLPAREIERSAKAIFYLHGLARRNNEARGDNLVLARSDFEVAYEGSARIFLENLLLSYPILFLGCSLAEPAVHEALRRVHKVHAQIRREYKEMEPPRRYVLLPVRRRTAHDVNFETRSERDLDTELAEDERFSELAVRVF